MWRPEIKIPFGIQTTHLLDCGACEERSEARECRLRFNVASGDSSEYLHCSSATEWVIEDVKYSDGRNIFSGENVKKVYFSTLFFAFFPENDAKIDLLSVVIIFDSVLCRIKI